MKGYLASLLTLLLFVGGCAAGTGLPPLRDASFDKHGIHSIALQPIVFRDAGPTNYCERDIENQVRFHLARYLQAKGYEVLRVEGVTRPHGAPPDPLADGAPENILRLSPAQADAVLVVWVEHYRQFGLCDMVRQPYLEMGASAALYSRAQGAEIWRHQTYVADYTSVGNPVPYVTHQLARQLLLTLPDR